MFRQLALEEVADDRRDLGSLAFEREMTGLEQVDLGVRMVALERLRAGRQEERIVLAPYGEKWRPPGADVFLEFGIERDIALIVAKQIELDLVVARAGEERRIQRPAIRRQTLRRGHAVRVLPLYAVTYSRLSSSDSDVARCVVCGQIMDKWDSTKVPTFKLVHRLIHPH